jgi:hypothetical protein
MEFVSYRPIVGLYILWEQVAQFRSTWDKRNIFCIIELHYYNRPPNRCFFRHAKLRNKL